MIQTIICRAIIHAHGSAFARFGRQWIHVTFEDSSTGMFVPTDIASDVVASAHSDGRWLRIAFDISIDTKVVARLTRGRENARLLGKHYLPSAEQSAILREALDQLGSNPVLGAFTTRKAA